MACFKVLTGFKYIGEKIHQWETLQRETLQSPPPQQKNYSFIFGAEESYGYLLGTHSRDKDAIVSCCLIAEMALHFKKQGKTLIDFLEDIYQKYGVFREAQISLAFSPGKEGMEAMQKTMKNLRNNPLESVLGKKVLILDDYEKGLHDLPPSNVLFLRPQLEEAIAEADEKLQNLLEECQSKILG